MDGFVQKRHNSSELAMELHLPRTKPSMCYSRSWHIIFNMYVAQSPELRQTFNFSSLELYMSLFPLSHPFLCCFSTLLYGIYMLPKKRLFLRISFEIRLYSSRWSIHCWCQSTSFLIILTVGNLIYAFSQCQSIISDFHQSYKCIQWGILRTHWSHLSFAMGTGVI